jgi:hypothetical protein
MTPERESRYIAAFLRRRFPTMLSWPEDNALAWVQWFMRYGRAIALYDKGRIAAVCLFRLVDDPEQAKEHYKDTAGPVAFIDITAGREGSMPALFRCLRLTVPHADTMAWTRSKHNFRPVVVPMARMVTRLA